MVDESQMTRFEQSVVPQLDPAYAQFRDETRFWIQRVAVPLILVVGMFGNLVTVIIMTRRRMRSTTNMYLAALALVDMLYLMLTFLLGLSHYPNMAGRRYYLYWRLRPFLMMLTDACSNTSVWLIVTFTIERFIAVKYPMKGKVWCTETRAKKLIVGVFLFGILLAAPVPFEWKVIEKPVGVGSLGQMRGQLNDLGEKNDDAASDRKPAASDSTQNGPLTSTWNSSTESSLANNQRSERIFAPPNDAGDSRSRSSKQEHGGSETDEDPWRKQQQPNNMVPQRKTDDATYILSLDYTDFGRNETYKTIYYWSTAVIFYFVPLLLLTFFNVFLILSVHRSLRERNLMTTGQQSNQSRATTKLGQLQANAAVKSGHHSNASKKSTLRMTNGRDLEGGYSMHQTMAGDDDSTKFKTMVNKGQTMVRDGKSEVGEQFKPKSLLTTKRILCPKPDCIVEADDHAEGADLQVGLAKSVKVTEFSPCSRTQGHRDSSEIKNHQKDNVSQSSVKRESPGKQFDHQNELPTEVFHMRMSGRAKSKAPNQPTSDDENSVRDHPLDTRVEFNCDKKTRDDSTLLVLTNCDKTYKLSVGAQEDLEKTSLRATLEGNLKQLADQATATGVNSNNGHRQRGNTTTTMTKSYSKLLKIKSTLGSSPNISPESSYENGSCTIQASAPMAPVSSQERRITIMLIAVVILFLCCQIPSAAMLLYTSVREPTPNTNEHALVLAFGNIFNFLMAVNAAGNFILYSFLSKKYRRTFVILFCGCLEKRSDTGNGRKNNYDDLSTKRQSSRASYYNSHPSTSSSGLCNDETHRANAGSNRVMERLAKARCSRAKACPTMRQPVTLESSTDLADVECVVGTDCTMQHRRRDTLL